VDRNRREEIGWRCWWDGGRPGAVARSWGVLGWPHVFVLDPAGIIRHKNVLGPDLDRAVDELLNEMPAVRDKGGD
jgi:hypothetical protein